MSDNVELFRFVIGRGSGGDDLSVTDEVCRSEFTEHPCRGDAAASGVIEYGEEVMSTRVPP